MLGISRACRKGICHFPAVQIVIVVVDLHLICIIAEVRTDVQVQVLLGSVGFHLFKGSLCGGIQPRIIAFRQAVALVYDQDPVYVSAAVFLFQMPDCHRNGLGNGIVSFHRNGDVTLARLDTGHSACIVYGCNRFIAAAPKEIAGTCRTGGGHVHRNAGGTPLQHCQISLVHRQIQNVLIGGGSFRCGSALCRGALRRSHNTIALRNDAGAPFIGEEQQPDCKSQNDKHHV